MRALRLTVLAIAAPVLASALSGCIVVPPRHYHGGGGGYGAGYGESYGPPPVQGYIWIDGYWDWRGGRRQWVEPHWGPPRR